MVELSDDSLVDTIVADRYRVIRKIAEGGMSAIYEAQHVKLARSFALKALLPELAMNQEAIDRFEREAELLAQMRHHNVVDISDFVYLDNGAPCMVLEFLHGATLQIRLARGPMSWDAIGRIGDQAMSALALAHRNGITHRDLKPENLFIWIDDVGEERVKLLDFGVSKLRGMDRLSGVHRLLGTPSYMSPEQASGQTDLVGPPTDVWAMGAILYEMATQKVAFSAEDLEGTLGLIIAGWREPITSYRADAPASFVELIDRALTTDPAQRIQTIEELRDRLRQALVRTPRLQLKTPPAGVPLVPAAQTISPVAMVAPPSAEDRAKKSWLVFGIAAAVVTAINVVIALLL